LPGQRLITKADAIVQIASSQVSISDLASSLDRAEAIASLPATAIDINKKNHTYEALESFV